MGSNKWARELPDSFSLTTKASSSGSEIQNKQWILTRRGVNPPAITIQSDPDNHDGSVFIFSRYREGKLTVLDPKAFIKSPELNDFSPNWIQFSYSPLEDLAIDALYWVPDPEIICGAMKLNNQSSHEKKVLLDLVGQLSMKSKGVRLKGREYAGRDLLVGKLGSKDLLLFLSGNTKLNLDPYPCLTTEHTIRPEKGEELRWIIIIGSSLDKSLQKMEQYIDLDWKGEISRSKISRQGRIEILTGDREWDFALALTQKEAESFWIKQTMDAPADQETALCLTPVQALCLLEALSPIDRELGLKIAENALQGMVRTGKNKGLSPVNYNKAHDLPLIGELVMELVDLHGTEFLDERIINHIEASLQKWFSPKYDIDQDGIPELTSPDQFNLFDYFHPKGEIPIKRIGHLPYFESPGLAAVLTNDLVQFFDLSLKFGRTESNRSFQHLSERLKVFISESWDQEDCIFYARDRDTHISLSERILLDDLRNGFTVIKEILPRPSRISVLIRGDCSKDHLSGLWISFHGTDSSDSYRVERLTFNHFQFLEQYGWGTSETSFQSLDYLTVVGLGADHSLVIFQPNSKRVDISHLLPLWGGSINKSHAGELIDNTLIDPERFWSPFGLRSFPDPSGAAVQLPWNILVGRGLLNYGERKLAADLFTNLIKAITINLKSYGHFFSAYLADTGKGIGTRNSPEGLVPVGLFLKIVGVKILPGREIIIEGEYPYPWPIKVHYQGFFIQRDSGQTRIDIPGEESQIVSGSGRLVIPLHSSPSVNFST